MSISCNIRSQLEGIDTITNKKCDFKIIRLRKKSKYIVVRNY